MPAPKHLLCKDSLILISQPLDQVDGSPIYCWMLFETILTQQSMKVSIIHQTEGKSENRRQ